MSENLTQVDACGLSCPLPVLLTRKAIGGIKKGTIEVKVDSGTARDNVARTGQSAGWTVTVEEEPGGIFRILLNK